MKKGKLSDLCIVIAGQSPQGSAYNDKGEGIEFHQGKKAFGESYLTPSNVWTTEITKIAEPLDILMSVRAPVGPTNITDRRICIGRGLAAIRCKEGVLQKFILYALKNIESKIVGNDGAVFNSINKAQIEALPVPIIPLSEQERIVSLLDAQFAKIDAIKANAEKQLQDTKALFQSALKDYLTPKEEGKYKQIKDVCDKESSTLKQKDIEGKEGKYPVFGASGYISSIDTYHQDKDYIAIVKDGSGIGRVTFMPAYSSVIGTMQYILPKEGYNIKYISYCLQSLDLSSYKQGAAIPHIYFRDYGERFVRVEEDILKQERIVALLDKLSAKIQSLQSNFDTTVTLCNDLKQSILKDIFG